ncbi:hypothetical protein BJ322DRAFT_1024330 [Thelephora terrestris]|uniref:Uncharacterized protein n=1 Tax=Thelephora terrestris TaxID=56493 RepID=A0A9P6H507_9AGAM|nr:hypothetical protein BJ322DRAFT_1024330 [Thelephora terrestris]
MTGAERGKSSPQWVQRTTWMIRHQTTRTGVRSGAVEGREWLIIDYWISTEMMNARLEGNFEPPDQRCIASGGQDHQRRAIGAPITSVAKLSGSGGNRAHRTSDKARAGIKYAIERFTPGSVEELSGVAGVHTGVDLRNVVDVISGFIGSYRRTDKWRGKHPGRKSVGSGCDLPANQKRSRQQTRRWMGGPERDEEWKSQIVLRRDWLKQAMSKGQCAITMREDEGRNRRAWLSTAGNGGTQVQKFVYQIDWRWLETVAGVSKKRGTRHQISVAALDLENALPDCSCRGKYNVREEGRIGDAQQQQMGEQGQEWKSEYLTDRRWDWPSPRIVAGRSHMEPGACRQTAIGGREREDEGRDGE